tara:strand:+ start:2332 stop:3222 length:891 start_codon:yes stop_codon:yes gene_type:complete
MGTPDFSVPVLDALLEDGHDICAVYSQPPRPAGRGKKLRPSPVQARAEELGLEVRHPVNFAAAGDRAAFAALDADIAVVVAYGLLLPEEVLTAPRFGCINVHASLLPRWRGAAPIQRAIESGDPMTGVTIMQMERGLDTGDMLLRGETPTAGKTCGDLHDELAKMGAKLMVNTLSRLTALTPLPQDEVAATYAAKIAKSEARLDFTKPAGMLEREVRAFSPFPGAWFELDEARIKLLRAEVVDGNGAPGIVLDDQLTIACGDRALRPVELQRAGKPAMPLTDFLRGNPVAKGTVLT